MLSRKITAGTLAVGAVAIAVASASPAMAAPSSKVWIKTASASSGTQAFTATNTNDFRITNTRGGAYFNCGAGKVVIKGTAKLGNAITPVTNVASITSATFSGCTFSTGVPVSVTSTNLPWALNAPNTSTNPVPASPATAPVAGQQTVGNISGVQANATIGSCTVGFGNGTGGSGIINPATFINGSSTSTLSILTANSSSSTIGINTVSTSPCVGGAIVAGDKAFISSSASTTTAATFSVTPDTGTGPLSVEAY